MCVCVCVCVCVYCDMSCCIYFIRHIPVHIYKLIALYWQKGEFKSENINFIFKKALNGAWTRVCRSLPWYKTADCLMLCFVCTAHERIWVENKCNSVSYRVDWAAYHCSIVSSPFANGGVVSNAVTEGSYWIANRYSAAVLTVKDISLPNVIEHLRFGRLVWTRK